MANKKIMTQEYELLQMKLLQLARSKAGGRWTDLCRALPLSSSHMSLIKNGKSRIGGDVLCRLLEYVDILAHIETIIDNKLMGRECK